MSLPCAPKSNVLSIFAELENFNRAVSTFYTRLKFDIFKCDFWMIEDKLKVNTHSRHKLRYTFCVLTDLLSNFLKIPTRN